MRVTAVTVLIDRCGDASHRVVPLLQEAHTQQHQQHATDSMAEWQIFCLGTNNWQGGGEFAPGSGILHEGHHKSLNELPSVAGGCYSMWPSKTQRTDPARPDYRVFPLTHDIPICESISPVSSYRWHGMGDDEFAAYLERLTGAVLAYTAEVEAATGRPFNLFIAHHTFTNPTVLIEVNDRRVAAGKPRVPIVAFAHGTALKMYLNEGKGLADFPPRFLPWVQGKGTFESTAHVAGVYAIADAQKATFSSVFPAFPAAKVAVVPNGYNQDVFRKDAGATVGNVLAEMPPVLYAGFDAATIDGKVAAALGFAGGQAPTAIPVDSITDVVLFVGKFADWKRLDVALRAAALYEPAYAAQQKRVVTLVVGWGPEEDQRLYMDMAYKTLGLTNTFFLGAQPQPALARLATIASVGVFPSKDEPFGLVFVECMSCGTPVIGARSGGPVEFVKPDVGHLIEESDDHAVLAERLAAAVTEYLDTGAKARMGARCIEYAVGKFSLAAQCETMLEHVKTTFAAKL
jgi:glycosyltransferase involved in cell wall biosynthesis